MVIAAILLLLLIAVSAAWFGHRNKAIGIFTITFIASVLWFFHHMTSDIGLSL